MGNNNGMICKISIPIIPKINATQSDWRTMDGIFSGVRAPWASATSGVVAIMMPLNSNIIGIHKPTPTAIAARSSADICPAIMVSINPKPAAAN